MSEPKNLRVDRKDFVPDGVCCSYCDAGRHSRFRAGIAYVVLPKAAPYGSWDGATFAGPECIKKITENPACPDFTRGIPSPQRSSPPERSDAGPKSARLSSWLDLPYLKEYLRLRVEKLHPAGFHGAVTQEIQGIYDRFGSKKATWNDWRHIDALIKRQDASNGLYSFRRLQACYAAHHWLNRVRDRHIEKTKAEPDFIASITAQLRAKLFLSKAQIEAANNWIANEEGIKELRLNDLLPPPAFSKPAKDKVAPQDIPG
jgi:hypothetical protein